jgi:hypothetical protein
MDESHRLPRDHLQAAVTFFVRALRFWWVTVGVLVVGSVAATGYAVVLHHARYQSQATAYYQEGIQWSLANEPSSKRVGARLKETILAHARLSEIIKEMNLFPKAAAADKMADAVEEMRQRTTFRMGEGDTFIISYIGDTPDEVQRVTAKLTDEMVDENLRLRSEQAEVAEAFLAAEKTRNEESLRAKETEVARFLARHPEFATEVASTTGAGAAVRATTKKGDVLALQSGGDPTLLALRREEDRLRKQITTPPGAAHVNDPALVAAKNEAEAKLGAAKRDLADKRARFTEQHPDVRAAAAYVKDAEQAYQRAVEAMKPPADGASDVVEIEPKAALESRLAQVQQEIRDYQKKHAAPSTGAEAEGDASSAAQGIVAVEAEWARLNREVADARERFQQLDTKQFVASMAASSLTSGQGGKIIVIDPAYKPARPMGTSSKKLVLLGILGSLGAGVALALLCAVIDDRVYDRADIDKLGVGPVLIEVPAWRVARG